MKLLIVTQYFYPENFRINDLALELKNRGHEVAVFTGQPNYPEGNFYDGYGFFRPKKELWNGIHIIRTPLLPRKKGKLNLVLNYFSFALFASWKAHFYPFERFDAVYVFETSPVTVALPAIVIKKRYRIPLIMNVQDLWPENVVAITGCHSPLMIKPLKKLVKYIYKHCDLILTASQSFIPNIQSYLSGKEQNKVKFWPQYATVDPASHGKSLFDSSCFNFVFTGNLGEAQGLDLVIEAAEILKGTNIRWHLIGDGRDRARLEAEIKSRDLGSYIILHGRKPEKQIPYYLHDASAALLILKPSPIFDMTIPAKLQTYLACGIPVLGCTGGESKKMIEGEKLGLTCDCVSAKELAKQALVFSGLSQEKINQFGENAKACNKAYFCKETLIGQLEKSIDELRTQNV